MGSTVSPNYVFTDFFAQPTVNFILTELYVKIFVFIYKYICKDCLPSFGPLCCGHTVALLCNQVLKSVGAAYFTLQPSERGYSTPLFSLAFMRSSVMLYGLSYNLRTNEELYFF